jgi:nucleotide-binding universal stress UspA family protein
MEVKRIVVGVDGSPAAGAALEWALGAVAKGGELLAVHGTAQALIGSGGRFGGDGVGMFAGTGSGRDARRLVEEHYCAALRDADVAHRVMIVDSDPVDALFDVARREDADLIVIGHQSDGGFVHRLLQGLSDHLIDHARRPVVVVPFRPANHQPADVTGV